MEGQVEELRLLRAVDTGLERRDEIAEPELARVHVGLVGPGRIGIHVGDEELRHRHLIGDHPSVELRKRQDRPRPPVAAHMEGPVLPGDFARVLDCEVHALARRDLDRLQRLARFRQVGAIALGRRGQGDDLAVDHIDHLACIRVDDAHEVFDGARQRRMQFLLAAVAGHFEDPPPCSILRSGNSRRRPACRTRSSDP